MLILFRVSGRGQGQDYRKGIQPPFQAISSCDYQSLGHALDQKLAKSGSYNEAEKEELTESPLVSIGRLYSGALTGKVRC